MERDGISALKFEAARMHFLSDVFAAVAVVVAVVVALSSLVYRILSLISHGIMHLCRWFQKG